MILISPRHRVPRVARRWSRIRLGYWTFPQGRGLTQAEIGRRILGGLDLKATEASIPRFFFRHKISLKAE